MSRAKYNNNVLPKRWFSRDQACQEKSFVRQAVRWSTRSRATSSPSSAAPSPRTTDTSSPSRTGLSFFTSWLWLQSGWNKTVARGCFGFTLPKLKLSQTIISRWKTFPSLNGQPFKSDKDLSNKFIPSASGSSHGMRPRARSFFRSLSLLKPTLVVGRPFLHSLGLGMPKKKPSFWVQTSYSSKFWTPCSFRYSFTRSLLSTILYVSPHGVLVSSPTILSSTLL